MNRNIKTITKILLIILIAIAVLLILPKIDSAANSPVVGKDKDGKDVTIDELTRGSLLRGDWNNKGNVFDNKYVFCCERGQSLLRPNDSYAMFEVKKEIYMDEDGDLWAWNGNLNNDDAILISKNAQAYKFIQGLIYILSQEDPNAGKFYNATQCALWAYLQNYKDKDTYDGGSKTVFNFKDAKDITISETEKYIVAPDNTKYEIAYKWYKEAENNI